MLRSDSEGKGRGEDWRRFPAPFLPRPQGGASMIDGEWGSLIGFRGLHRNPLVIKGSEERRESTDTSDGIIGDAMSNEETKT